MSRLPPFDPLDPGIGVAAIPAILATPEEQNSRNSKNSKATLRQQSPSGCPESEVPGEQLTTFETPIGPTVADNPESVLQVDPLIERAEASQVQVDFSALGLKVDEPHIPTIPDLLAWASELGEQNLVLPARVTYVEAPLRTITTERVSWYATLHLRTISHARLNQRNGGWGQFTPKWWKEQEEQALGALIALREAIQREESAVGDGNG